MKGFFTNSISKPKKNTGKNDGKGKNDGNGNKRKTSEQSVAAIAEQNKQRKAELGKGAQSGKGGKGASRGGHQGAPNGWYTPWGVCFACYSEDHPWWNCRMLALAIARNEKSPWLEPEQVSWMENTHDRVLRLNEFRQGMNEKVMAKADELARSGTNVPVVRSSPPPDSKWHEAATRYENAKKRRQGKGANNRTGYGNRSAKLASSTVAPATDDGGGSQASSWEDFVVENGEIEDGDSNLLDNLFEAP